jgi:hypothetical protein
VFPSLSQPTLFSILTFEAPNLIAYVARLKPQLIPALDLDLDLLNSSSNFIQRSIKDIGSGWAQFTRAVGTLFQSESISTPEKRRERFYNWLSVFGALVVFGSFFGQAGLVSFNFDEPAFEDDDA